MTKRAALESKVFRNVLRALVDSFDNLTLAQKIRIVTEVLGSPPNAKERAK